MSRRPKSARVKGLASPEPLGLSSKPNRVPIAVGKGKSARPQTAGGRVKKSVRKPAWDSTIHNLKGLKMSADERKAKRSHENRYAITNVKKTAPKPKKDAKPAKRATTTSLDLQARLARLERDARLLQLSEGQYPVAEQLPSLLDLIQGTTGSSGPVLDDEEDESFEGGALDDSMFPSEETNPFANDSMNVMSPENVPSAVNENEMSINAAITEAVQDAEASIADADTVSQSMDINKPVVAPGARSHRIDDLDMDVLQGIDVERFIRYVKEGTSSSTEDAASVAVNLIANAAATTEDDTPAPAKSADTSTIEAIPTTTTEKESVDDNEHCEQHGHHHHHHHHHDHADGEKKAEPHSAFGGSYPPTRAKKPLKKAPDYLHQVFSHKEGEQETAVVKVKGKAKPAVKKKPTSVPTATLPTKSARAVPFAAVNAPVATASTSVPLEARKRAALTGKPFMIEMEKIIQAAGILDDQVNAFEAETGRGADAHGDTNQSGKRSLQRKQGLGVLSESLISTMSRLVGYLTDVERATKIRDADHSAARDELHAVTESNRLLEGRVSLLETENRSLRDELRSTQSKFELQMAELHASVTKLQRGSDAEHMHRMMTSLQFGGQGNGPATLTFNRLGAVERADQIAGIAASMPFQSLTEPPMMRGADYPSEDVPMTNQQQQHQREQVRVEEAAVDLDNVVIETVEDARPPRTVSVPQVTVPSVTAESLRRAVDYADPVPSSTHPGANVSASFNDAHHIAGTTFGDVSIAAIAGSTYTARSLQTGTAPEVTSSLTQKNFMEEPLRRTIDARGRHVVKRTFPSRARLGGAAESAQQSQPRGGISGRAVEVHIPLHSSHDHSAMSFDGGDVSDGDMDTSEPRSRVPIPMTNASMSQNEDHIALALAAGYGAGAGTPNGKIQWSALGGLGNDGY